MRIHACVATLFAGLCVSISSAQAAEAWQEYDKIINGRQAIAALGPTLFGDNVNLANGGLSFATTDVSIPGNNALPVAVTRTFSVKSKAGFPDPDRTVDDGHFGDWELDLPNISGVYATATGWVNGNSGKALLRCSVANTTEAASPNVTVGTSSFRSHMIWHGNRINIPGRGSAAMLVAKATTPKPSAGGPYYWVTSDWTALSCLPSIQNGSGEGFLAITADGTKYWFNHMAAASAAHLRQKRLSTAGYDELTRKRYGLYATRVEDRFGNWVTYTYSNAATAPVRLTSINSSDGRSISASYASDRIASLSDGSHTWQYQYSGTSLTAVILPDSSRWTIAFNGLNAVLGYLTGEPGEQWRDCNNPGDLRGTVNPTVGTITHPSGATGEFTIGPVRFRRDNVPVDCATGDQKTTNDDVSWYPNVWDAYALTRKRVTGPGLPTADWNYTYEHESAGTTTVVSPGNYAQYTFGKTFLGNEGKLLSTKIGSGPTAILKTEVSTFQLATSGQPYPTPIGDSPQVRSDDFTEEYPRPQLSHTISQQGVTFQSQVIGLFDDFARPLSVAKSSTLGYSKTDTTQYFDQPSKWVLGQVSQTTTDGIVTSETYYDPTTALPMWSKAFGKLQQTLTYNLAPGTQAGTIATVKDGRNLTTTLSNWHRGVPRNVLYADNTTQSAVVNDSGWITQNTDQNGFQNNYTYDAMGRLASLAYPTADTVAWNTTTQSFTQIGTSEYGIPAGHWRQTVSTGNGRKEAYFDALWRPILSREYDNNAVTATSRFTRRAFDESGREAFVSYPGSTHDQTAGMWTLYDALGRVTSQSQDSELGLLTARTEYLPGFKTRVTPPKAPTTAPAPWQTTTTYMAYDQPTLDMPIAIAHPEGAFTDIVRDVFGKPTWLTRRNADGSLSAQRRYFYNTQQEMCRVMEPETGGNLMGYDAAGNLAWSASGLHVSTACNANGDTAAIQARKVIRQYDLRNRISALTFPDGRGNQNWTYTPDGLPATVTTYNETNNTLPAVNAYAYNKRRLQTSERLQFSGYDWSIGTGYNANGHVASTTYPDSLTVDYAPNALGQPTRTGIYATGVSYHPNGAIKQFNYGNGMLHVMTQNLRQLPGQVCDTAGAGCGPNSVINDSYSYDTNGNVAAIRDGRTGNRGDRTMTYDGLDRLTQTTSPMYDAAGATYRYDVLDNLTQMIAPGRNHGYVYDGNWRLTNLTNGVGGPTVTGLGYDVQGNVANIDGSTFSFDIGNRLRNSSGQGKTTSYAYDGHGRRVRDWTAGSRYSFYSRAGALMFSNDHRAARNTNYIYLGNSLVGTRDSAHGSGTITHRYQHTDALGTPVVVTDVGRSVIERSEYEPYGQRLAGGTPAVKDGIGYTGHVMDAATGLTYMQQRYYDPTIGRFLSVDPVTANSSDGSNFNRYKYASNNPYRFSDPDGRMDKETRRELLQDRRSLNAHMSFNGQAGSGVVRSSASRGAAPPGGDSKVASPVRGNAPGWIVSSDVNKDDVPPTLTGSWAAGVGVKGEKQLGAENDRVAFVIVGLGKQATATWSLLKVGYDFGGKPASEPVDVAVLSGKAGFGGVVGFEIRYVPPGKIYAEATYGTGVAAQFDVFNIGYSVEK